MYRWHYSPLNLALAAGGVILFIVAQGMVAPGANARAASLAVALAFTGGCFTVYGQVRQHGVPIRPRE